ncbi:MAG: VWA domain-containing protein [Phycisphaerales bacterium]|nr:VWA domain-containing protein [Phycisphaerales bacterium]
MTIAAPWVALVLLSTLVPVLLMLWMLKLRRSRVRVPAAWLWSESLEDLRAQVPFKRLRWSMLLALQLIALGLLILAAARPRVTTDDGRGERTVLLVDVSGSMGTRDEPGGERRLERVRQSLRAAVDRLHPGGLFNSDAGRTMLIAVGATPRVVQPFTSSRQVLLAAIDQIERTDEAASIEGAFELARAWAAVPDPDAVETAAPAPVRLELFSDGQIDDLETAAATLRESLLLHQVGDEDTVNRGLVQVGGHRLPEAPHRLRPFVTLEGWGLEPETIDVRLAADGVGVALRRVELPAARLVDDTLVPGRIDVLFPPIDAPDHTLLSAQLLPADALDTDDTAWRVIPPPDRARAAPAGEIGPVLARAMSAVDMKMTTQEQADLLVGVLDSPVRLGARPSLTFGAPPVSAHVGTALSVRSPDRVITSDPRHPVTGGSSLSGLRVQEAVHLQVSDEVRTLAEGQNGPLIVAWREDGVPRVHVAFEMEQSDWQMREDIITFMVDAQAWLAGRSDERDDIRAGDTINLVLPGAVDSVEVLHAGTQLAVLTPPDPSRTQWGPAPLAGVYEFHWQSGDASGVDKVAVAMPGAEAGDVRGRTPDLKASAGDVAIVAAGTRQMPLWPFAVGVAFVVLLIEWWVWTRRQ